MFRTIIHGVQKYNFVVIRTKYPGGVFYPTGDRHTTAHYQYQPLRCNVDQLKILQLGLAVLERSASRHRKCYKTHIHFKFSLVEDIDCQPSIDGLTNSDCQDNMREELLIDLSDSARWLSFHSGCPPIFFGYSLNLRLERTVPSRDSESLELLRIYSSAICGVTFLTKVWKIFNGVLQELAEHLEIQPIRLQYSRRSERLLTRVASVDMRTQFF